MMDDNQYMQMALSEAQKALEQGEVPIGAVVVCKGSVIVQKVKEGKKDFGFNARTETYENLLAAGVIDPTKVSRVALENAASVAGMFLATECAIVDKPEKAPAMMPNPNAGMEGMM